VDLVKMLVFAGALALTPAVVMAQPWSAAVTEASVRVGIPAAWIEAVIRLESGGDPRAISPKGAMGLMQLMPQTWRELHDELGLGPDPFEPRDNVLAGATYLRRLYDRYGSPGFLAAYNAGPGRLDGYVLHGRALPVDTRRYVAALSPAITAIAKASGAKSPIFAVVKAPGVAPERRADFEPRLFVVRRESPPSAP
jgi:soluble lytic murein transglycosylase-like protein